MNNNLKKLILAALFAALSCVATMSIRIPTPGTGGYIHPGDAIVILSGVILGPVWGFLAGGIGSALSDLIGGYFIYVPITFVIKGLVALAAGLLYQKVGKNQKSRYIAVILGGVADIILVAGGYFVCEFFIYGAGAAASIPANIIQGVGGLVISCILYPILISIPNVRQTAVATGK
ncbi:ECF transporter S component [Blautia glucerasea]|uniref:ECF transporter S component n=1 Tax=Blautia glucerasea TaxID=536633 RepID=UPI001D08A871|nr:ECF transporter S component [Blautia glucerasea]MCB6545550.1 ECF transporter S component [Blautia glucerasea]